ncbi:hypothetical protein JRQ81_012165 [Phrynocephalus forsythii]|uniref:Uncharacterized protein n=1 Tax=Phrynocephalus forsythii TaxID=171643 RepID=A0A9Q0X696_9SAUR|nr:hypothetical protein JRQ81_012165 [Phrynocephalus forsythii]
MAAALRSRKAVSCSEFEAVSKKVEKGSRSSSFGSCQDRRDSAVNGKSTDGETEGSGRKAQLFT